MKRDIGELFPWGRASRGRLSRFFRQHHSNPGCKEMQAVAYTGEGKTKRPPILVAARGYFKRPVTASKGVVRTGYGSPSAQAWPGAVCISNPGGACDFAADPVSRPIRTFFPMPDGAGFVPNASCSCFAAEMGFFHRTVHTLLPVLVEVKLLNSVDRPGNGQRSRPPPLAAGR